MVKQKFSNQRGIIILTFWAVPTFLLPNTASIFVFGKEGKNLLLNPYNGGHGPSELFFWLLWPPLGGPTGSPIRGGLDCSAIVWPVRGPPHKAEARSLFRPWPSSAARSSEVTQTLSLYRPRSEMDWENQGSQSHSYVIFCGRLRRPTPLFPLCRL